MCFCNQRGGGRKGGREAKREGQYKGTYNLEMDIGQVLKYKKQVASEQSNRAKCNKQLPWPDERHS